jgi:hypothetical protein
MIRIHFLIGLLCLPMLGRSQSSSGITTDRNLFFAENQGRDLASFAAGFLSNRVGLSTSVLRYGQGIGVKQAQLSGETRIGVGMGVLIDYQQFGNENYVQQRLGSALALRLGERAALSAGAYAERQRFGDNYGSATTFAGGVSVAAKWGIHGNFLGSAYFPFLKPSSIYDKRNTALFAYGYRFDKQLLLTASLRLDERIRFGCSLSYSPNARIQLVVGNLNTSQRLFGQIALRLGACCWIKQTVLLQRAWGNSYEIGFYYAPKN